MCIFACLLVTGCVFQDVRRQQTKLDAVCLIGGTVTTEHRNTQPILVGLVRHTGGDFDAPQNWTLADHFVLEGEGRWMFRAQKGTYGLLAFEDTNTDHVYQPGEPFLPVEPQRLFSCSSGERKTDMTLIIPTQGRSALEQNIDFMTFPARTPADQLQASLGLLTAYGEVVTLEDPRFSEETATNSLWRPYDFVFDVHPGVYFLHPYEPEKIPVLFVHGINGTPRNFRALIEGLDLNKFQPWVYYYPSGGRLSAIADHLDQTMKQLQLRHGFARYYVIAHSMGGLVSRGFILRNQTGQSRARIPLSITISTPWAGHKAAESGIKYAPAVVGVWNDMAPKSAYLTDLFFIERDGASVHRSLPGGVRHHLLFGYKRGATALGECADGTVTLASQLYLSAQHDASRIYGFDETHMSILDSVETSQVVNRLLDETTY